MRRAGVATGIAQGVVVLEREDDEPPGIGAPVVDERLDPVGRVVDVIGPVERPYLVVSPADGVTPAALLGETLYVR